LGRELKAPVRGIILIPGTSEGLAMTISPGSSRANPRTSKPLDALATLAGA
jgi:hypothetical protein